MRWFYLVLTLCWPHDDGVLDIPHLLNASKYERLGVANKISLGYHLGVERQLQ
jgi:hypothetical protein